MESKSNARKSMKPLETRLQVIDRAALKRLASAVQFRPWPPHSKQLRDRFSGLLKNSFGTREDDKLKACRTPPSGLLLIFDWNFEVEIIFP
jgi:hypothetical protein